MGLQQPLPPLELEPQLQLGPKPEPPPQPEPFVLEKLQYLRHLLVVDLGWPRQLEPRQQLEPQLRELRRQRELRQQLELLLLEPPQLLELVVELPSFLDSYLLLSGSFFNSFFWLWCLLFGSWSFSWSSLGGSSLSWCGFSCRCLSSWSLGSWSFGSWSLSSRCLSSWGLLSWGGLLLLGSWLFIDLLLSINLRLRSLIILGLCQTNLLINFTLYTSFVSESKKGILLSIFDICFNLAEVLNLHLSGINIIILSCHYNAQSNENMLHCHGLLLSFH